MRSDGTSRDRAKRWNESRSNEAQEHATVDCASMRHHPRSRADSNRADHRKSFQEAPIRFPNARCPQRLHPSSRRMPVLHADSSMKTSRDDIVFRSHLQNERRCARRSGVSRSSAVKVFFFARTRACASRAAPTNEMSRYLPFSRELRSALGSSRQAAPRRFVSAAPPRRRGAASDFRLREAAALRSQSHDGAARSDSPLLHRRSARTSALPHAKRERSLCELAHRSSIAWRR